MEDRPSHRRTPARWAKAAIALAAFAALGAGLAYAAGGPSVVQKSKTASLPNDNLAHSVKASCPKGTKVSGGGLKLSDPHDDYFQGSYPKGKTWTAFGYRASTFPGASNVTASAMCLHGAAVSQESKARTLPNSGNDVSVVAECPKGTELSGGGVELGDPNVDGVFGSYPSGKSGWKAVAYRNTPSGNSQVTSHALCAKNVKVTVAKKSEPLLDGGGVHDAVAKCPSGTVVSGGGAKVSHPSDYVQGSFAQGDRAWVAQGVGFSDTKVTAYALCLKH
jgi:hypothetical protein